MAGGQALYPRAAPGGGIVTPVAIVFVVLKLVHVISWSWWWVLSPLWTPVAAYLIAFTITYSIFYAAAKLRLPP